jgi:AraC family ethanolamine operon transcriptional activator
MSITHQFRDFDAFAHSVRGVDCVMSIQNPTSRIWSISEVDLSGGIRVQQGCLGSGNIVEGQSHSDGYLFYMPLTDRIKYSANGRILEKNAFAILEPGCEFCVSTKVAHDWYTVFVPAHKFARGGDLGEPSLGSEKMSCRVTRPNLQVANQFRAFVSQIMTAANCSEFEASLAATCAARELLDVTSLLVWGRQAGQANHPGRPRFSRQGIIRCCQELLEERDGELVFVEELAAAADVSERTLRTAFNEYFGIGPVRYLQLRQLHRVNHDLRASDPETESVTDVLLEHGVWEFGRFASRYRRLFGELPSETLRRRRR